MLAIFRYFIFQDIAGMRELRLDWWLNVMPTKTQRKHHPRQDRWAEHFELQEKRELPERIAIVGLTPVGRATARLLDMNEELRQALRYELLH